MGNCAYGKASCGSSPKSRIFGLPLESIWNAHQQCPKFLSIPINFIESECIPSRPGFCDRQCDQLLDFCNHAETFSDGTKGDMQVNLFYPETCACFISKFLYELPEPLLPRRHQRQLFDSMLDPSTTSHLCSSEKDNFDRSLIIQCILLSFPRPHFDLLRRLVKCFSGLSQSAEDQSVSHELAEIMGPLICHLPTASGETNKTAHRRSLHKNDDLILSQRLIAFMINNYNNLFENNVHRMYNTLNEVLSSVVQSHTELTELHEKLKRELEIFKTKACTKLFNRNTQTKAFFAWRSISSSSMQRHNPYQVIHSLKEDLKAVRLTSMMQQKRITQLTSKIDLEIFENELSSQILSPKRKSTTRAIDYLLVPGSPVTRSFSMRQSLSTPRNPSSRLSFAFSESNE